MKKNGKKSLVKSIVKKATVTAKPVRDFTYVMVYMPPADKKLLEKAAGHEGMKVSAFVRSAAVKAAHVLFD